MQLKVVAFDWEHTVMDEYRDTDVPLDTRPVRLMPDVFGVLLQRAVRPRSRGAPSNSPETQ